MEEGDATWHSLIYHAFARIISHCFHFYCCDVWQDIESALGDLRTNFQKQDTLRARSERGDNSQLLKEIMATYESSTLAAPGTDKTAVLQVCIHRGWRVSHHAHILTSRVL